MTRYDQTFESIDIADKRAMREKIQAMIAAWLASGNKVTQCGQPSYEQMMNKHRTLLCSGQKKPPTKPVGVA